MKLLILIKYIINVGEKQKGRAQSKYFINTEIKTKKNIEAIEKAIKYFKFEGENIYYKESPSSTIINSIKSYYEAL